ncbi:MAG TPA: phosphatidylserine/phosphatidylglycerophosphate/cardiolipin synthase family protein [Gemmatimonadales bacterium]|jgi:cardiolipin synthase|nr:phosphatidylserine/phosphatidylglycerophosphate/cardiolipin synthase family protein [Gemmatimonadales bacterium]
MTTPLTAASTRALDRATGSRPIPGNAVELLVDGPEAFPAMLAVIAGAERWIHFENYIIRSDATGWRFAEALAAKARAGVRVRVLVDWFGSYGTRARYWRFLRAAGCEVRHFRPLSLGDPLVNLSRDHRKLVLADGRDAIVGGLCIGDEWAGDPAHEHLPWRDTALRVRGPAAAALDASFARIWETTGGALPDGERPGRIPACGDAEVRVVAGVPGEARTYRLLTAVASACAERLWVTDAYLAPPPPLRRALIDAARDGCDLQLIVPGMSDIPFVRNLSRVGYRDLLAEGIRIFEWEGPMLHAKTFVADGRLARIGSSNLNYASLLGNWELDVLVDSPPLALALEQRFRRDVLGSREVLRRMPQVPAPLRPLVPGRLERREPEAAVGDHHVTLRERRRRAVITLYSVAAGASRSVFLPIFAAVLILAVLAFLLPRVVAVGTTLLMGWLTLSAARQLRRNHAPGVPPADWSRQA